MILKPLQTQLEDGLKELSLILLTKNKIDVLHRQSFPLRILIPLQKKTKIKQNPNQKVLLDKNNSLTKDKKIIN